MTLRILAQNLHAASASVAAALRRRDQPFLEDLTRRLDARGVDGLDLGVSSLTSSQPEEVDRLAWLARVVAGASRTPLLLDSPHPAVLCAVAAGGDAAWGINSLRDLDRLSPGQREVVRRGSGPVVLQLAPGGEPPRGLDDRRRHAETLLESAGELGLASDRIWLDPACLPWGEDVAAGQGLLDFVEESTRRWPEIRTVVGLSNVSWGHRDRRRLHRRWLRRLVDRGLGAALLDPLEEGLLEVLPAWPGDR